MEKPLHEAVQLDICRQDDGKIRPEALYVCGDYDPLNDLDEHKYINEIF